jgi:GTP-binding protein
VVDLGEDRPFVIADIPGLVAGAHQGAGLGLRFLRHIERTRLFLHVVDLSGADPLGDLLTVRAELKAYDPVLAQRASLVAANKLDLPEAQDQLDEFTQKVQAMGLEVWPVSAATGQGVTPLLEEIGRRLEAADQDANVQENDRGQG